MDEVSKNILTKIGITFEMENQLIRKHNNLNYTA